MLAPVDTNSRTNIQLVSGPQTINTIPETHALDLQPPRFPEFEKAIRAYIDDSLSDDIKKDFESASDILEGLQKILESGRETSISSSTSVRVRKVLQCLRHFMESVAISTGHSPEISSFIIGGVNCILTVRTRTLTWNKSVSLLM